MSERKSADEAAPRCEPRCPLCGGPNGCEPARTGSLASPCWCTEVTFSAELLARVPAPLQGQACICRRCAEGSSGLAGQGHS